VFEVNTAILLVVSLVGLVAIGVHIAIALGITSALGIWLVTGADWYAFGTVQTMLAATAYEAIRAYVFAVIPLFMLMGEFIGKSGTVTDVYRGINRLLRKIPGRLAIATVVGNALFSFVTGVSIASAAAFSRIAYPEMKRFGYHRGFALGSIAGSSCLGMLIPPSVLMIVWGILTEQSIGQIFAAGIFPGLLLAFLFIAYIFGFALLRPAAVGIKSGIEETAGKSGSDDEEVSTPQFLVSLVGIILVIVAVLGGIWFGIFTPTEASAVAVAYSLIVSLFILKSMTVRDLPKVLTEAAMVSSVVLLLVGAAMAFKTVVSLSHAPEILAAWIMSLSENPLILLFLINLLLFLVGMFLDAGPAIIILAPILGPIFIDLGIHPVHFAIIMSVNLTVGLATPPMGLVLFVASSVSGESMESISKAILPFLAIEVVVIFMITYIPAISLAIPRHFGFIVGG